MALLRYSAVLYGRNLLKYSVNQILYASDEKCAGELFPKTCRPKKRPVQECDKKALGEACEKDINECPKIEAKCCENMEATEVGEEAEKQAKQTKKEDKAVQESSEQTSLTPTSDQEETDMIIHEGDQEEIYDPKIVIIGAGIAGLAAANRLATTGVQDITILEASDRTGGRIRSTQFGETVVNLGGTFGSRGDDIPPLCSTGNPVMFHAEQLAMVRFRERIPLAMSLITECDGSPLPLAASFIAITKMKRILTVADSLKTTSPYNDHGKVDNFIGLRMKQELRLIPDELKVPAARVMAALTILSTGNTYINASTGEPAVEIPYSDTRIPLGCGGILSPLLQNIQSNIKFNKEVNNISWGSLSSLNGRRALVHTMDGTEYNADFVVFTPSLGVLKKRHETIFCPPLPSSKVRAIENLVFEQGTKIFLYYKKPIKSWAQSKIQWKMKAEDTKGLKGILEGLREITEVPEGDKILSVTIVGKGANRAETTSKRCIGDELTMYISKKSGDCAPLPDDILVTDWSTNKYFLGAYPTRGNPSLAEPLPSCGSPNPPVLFFAGDSTVDVNTGGIHGAFVSGLREANRILSYIPGKKDDIGATDACLQLQSSLST